jgi:hypothetical protein
VRHRSANKINKDAAKFWLITLAQFQMFGTQPTFTQVPPSSLASISAHFWPYIAARLMEAIPPLPPPMAM